MADITIRLIQGRTLACSAMGVLAVVILGGWVGGVPGAFLAVPALLTLRCWAEGHGGRGRLGEAIHLPSAGA